MDGLSRVERGPVDSAQRADSDGERQESERDEPGGDAYAAT